MGRVSTEAATAAIGLAGGLALFFISGNVGHYGGVPGFYVWGWPLTWRYEADLMGVGINRTFLYEDLLFWVATSIFAVELGSRLAFTAVRRLRMHYSRRDRMVSGVEKVPPESL